MQSKLFIDIGGTHLRSELEIDNKIVKDNINSQDIDLIEFIESKLKIYPEISYIGISFAGQVNSGKIISSPNIKVSNHNIKSFFEKNYNIKLEIDNDLNCAIRAESHYFNSKFITAIYIGTGLGCAVINNGKIVTGVSNQSFELGHIPYKESPFICGCGKSNCIELFASGLAIGRWSDYKNISYDNINLENKEIKEIFQEALIRAISTAITLSNSQILVLGGGVIKKNLYLIDWIKEEIKNQVMPNILRDIKIVSSKLDNGAIEGSRLLF